MNLNDIPIFPLRDLDNYENVSHWDTFNDFKYFADVCMGKIKETYKHSSYYWEEDVDRYDEKYMIGLMHHPTEGYYPLYLTPSNYVKYLSSVEQRFVEVEMYEEASECKNLINKIKKVMERNNLESLVNLVKNWADDKNLLTAGNEHNQIKKVVEEVQEIEQALQEGNIEDIKNEIGDGFVTLIILAHQVGLTPTDCLLSAYNKISKRKGKTINGIFVKD